jgi:hypothetical protein
MKAYALMRLTLLSAAALVACGKSGKEASGTPADSVSAATAGSLDGPSHIGRLMDSASMPGMGGMMGSRMMDSMQTHMRTMEGMSLDRLKAMIPVHRQMVANMLSSFDGSMRQMNMPPDTAWIALRDSISQDVTHMPDLSPSQLRTLIPRHHERLNRLMKMHKDMMGKVSVSP